MLIAVRSESRRPLVCDLATFLFADNVSFTGAGGGAEAIGGKYSFASPMLMRILGVGRDGVSTGVWMVMRLPGRGST
jgi:hypothetical protein